MKIVSGGQTGVDRAALDVALELGSEVGGWCPAGRRAEDGPIDARYSLIETPSADPAQRTGRNVRDSDGTLILPHRGRRSRAGPKPAAVARGLGRPLFTQSLASPDPEGFRLWLRTHGVNPLNVAGPRESEAPGIYRQAFGVLRRGLSF